MTSSLILHHIELFVFDFEFPQGESSMHLYIVSKQDLRVEQELN